MRTTPRLALAALLFLPVVGVACGGSDSNGSSGAAGSSSDHVSVVDNKFEPASVEVAVGDTVTWEFKGTASHDVKGDGFASPVKKDGTFEHQFNSAGTYDYICTIHPGMKGQIKVG